MATEAMERAESARTIEDIQAESSPPVDSPETPTSPAEEGAPDAGADSSTDARTAIKNDAFWSRITNKKTPSESPAAAGDSPPAPAEGATPDSGTPAKSPAKPSKKRKSPEIDPMKIAEVQGREMGQAIAAGMQQHQSPSAASPAVTAPPTFQDILASLPEEYQADVDTFMEMKQRWPDKYGKIMDDLADYAKKEEAYIKEWEQNNPGVDFDPDDGTHNNFYSRAQPKYSPRDFKLAEREIIKRDAKAEVSREFAPQLEKIERAERIEKLRPVMDAEVTEVAKAVLSGINPEYGAMDKAKLSSLGTKDPLAAEIAADVIEMAGAVAAANVHIHSGVEAFDANNPSHRLIFDIAQDMESRISALPVQDRFDEQGRVFATRSQWQQMSPKDQARHWILDQSAISHGIRERAKSAAATRYSSEVKKYQAWAKSQGVAPSAPSQASPPERHSAPNTDPRMPAQILQQSEPPNTPSVSGRAAIVQTASNQNGNVKSGRELFFGRLLGK